MMNESMLHQGFSWFNEPTYQIDDGCLILSTSPDTDFWQRTHYGFRRDNGHCLLQPTSYDFCLTVKTEFDGKMQYDQCGLMIRVDSENWIKTSAEYEAANHLRLGSVVTNYGYSDWATLDIDNRNEPIWYRIQSKNSLADFLIEYSFDHETWKQLRITHLHQAKDTVLVGIYACSPMQSSFEAKFSELSLTKSAWV